MEIGVHQPNFLPWSGYFIKFKKVINLFLDDALVSKKLDYLNRSLFLTNGKKIFYYTYK